MWDITFVKPILALTEIEYYDRKAAAGTISFLVGYANKDDYGNHVFQGIFIRTDTATPFEFLGYTPNLVRGEFKRIDANITLICPSKRKNTLCVGEYCVFDPKKKKTIRVRKEEEVFPTLVVVEWFEGP